MKQIEVTVKVNNSLNEVDEILTSKGFKVIRRSRVEDKYLTPNNLDIKEDNIIDVLNNSVLLRYLCVNNSHESRKITYKQKIYNNDLVISEEKINVNITDTESAEKLFKALKYKNLVDVNYDVIVYEKDNMELAFQDVENLGLVLEYENTNDFYNHSDEEIIKEKEKMVESIKSLGLDISDDYDIKKAYELIKLSLIK